MDRQVGSPSDEKWRECVVSEVELICRSEAFRQSKQSIRLLRHLVEHSIDQNDDELRERAIGASLFGREPKYDSNEDSIVRVSVAEVRKRLARYYHESGNRAKIELSIPLGSYKVEFQTAGSEQEVHDQSAVPDGSRKPTARLWLAMALIGALGLASAIVYLTRPVSKLEQFWGPAFTDKGAVVILAPHPIVYTFKRETFQRFRGDAATHAQRQIEVLSGPPEATIPLKEVVPIRDQYLGLGSAHAISDVTAMLAVHRKDYSIRFGPQFSFQDIRQAPAVLVGAYANRWTLQLTDESRFVLSDRDGAPEISDRQSGRAWQVKDLRPDGKTSGDFIIVSRLFHPKTGRLIVALAGITQYGTQAAGEFVTDENLLTQAMKDAPRGWDRKNVQFVLQVPVVEGVPGRPQVVASHYW